MHNSGSEVRTFQNVPGCGGLGFNVGALVSRIEFAVYYSVRIIRNSQNRISNYEDAYVTLSQLGQIQRTKTRTMAYHGPFFGRAHTYTGKNDARPCHARYMPGNIMVEKPTMQLFLVPKQECVFQLYLGEIEWGFFLTHVLYTGCSGLRSCLEP